MDIQKQMALIQFFAIRGNLVITKRNYNDKWCFCTHNKEGIGEANTFEEALSKLTKNVIPYLKEHEQNELIRILESEA